MRGLIIASIILCLPLQAWGKSQALLEALEEFLEFAEYNEGAITPEQMSSLGLQAFHVVDTRLKDRFEVSRIPGAVHIEWREIVAKRGQLPKEGTVVLYCDTGLLSSKAHFALRLLGHDNVKVLSGGFNGWQKRQVSETPVQW